MRANIFLPRASCFLFFLFIICCLATATSYCQQASSPGASAQPQFIDGAIMDGHAKNIAAPLFTEPQKKTPVVSSPTDLQLPGENRSVKKKTPEQNNTGSLDTSDAGLVAPTGAKPDKEVIILKTKGTDTLEDDGTALAGEEVNPVIHKYAEMISIHPYEMSNLSMYQFIDLWYGTKYKWGGSDKTGIDCSAFSQKMYGEVFGVDLSRTSRQQHHHCERIRDFEEASEGDLVFFRVHSFWISHVGVYLANGFFVHASRSHGVVISNLNDKYWHRRYAGCGRVPREDKSISESDFMP